MTLGCSSCIPWLLFFTCVWDSAAERTHRDVYSNISSLDISHRPQKVISNERGFSLYTFMAHPWIFEWWGSIQLVHMRSLSIILNGRSRNSWAPLPVCPCISYGHLCGHFSIATRGSNTSNVIQCQGPHRRTSRFSTTGVNHWLLYDHREQGTQHWSLIGVYFISHITGLVRQAFPGPDWPLSLPTHPQGLHIEWPVVRAMICYI